MERNKSKLRVLHSAALLRPPSGICTQMDWEQEAAHALGLEWQVKMFCPMHSKGAFKVMHFDSSINAENLNTRLKKLLAWGQLRKNYHNWLLNQQDKVDIFLLRYYVHDPFQLAFVKRCKKPVYFVHHTLEVPELALPEGIAGWIRSSLETFIGNPTIAKASGIIGMTQEIVDYELTRAGVPGKPSYVYPNGIIFNEQKLIDRRSEDIPEFLFVANFAPWHGLDRRLTTIAKSKEKFLLHLVGEIPKESLLLVQDSRIRIYGALTHEEIVILSQQCWIGLASFALDRKKMKQACPLKTREYLMLGLPVYGDYQDVFQKNTPYFRTGSENIEGILKFAKETRVIEKENISKLAQLSIDKKYLLAELFNFIQ